ncbi:MAG: 8-amino-7-oxononanoate synthase [Balneolaceae bacterium]|nr:8-amino-7-oxononanoate synthase [Balneolaceae bacterium]
MSKREDLPTRLEKRLEKRKVEHRYRSLETIEEIQSSRSVQIEGVEYLNFSSNDYLNLSGHPSLKERSAEYAKRFGASSSSSRLITGTLKIHRDLEERIAEIYRKEGALLFSTGFQANSTILPAITKKKDIILADALCHNSILTGCLASKASLYRFRHNDLEHLETFLKRQESKSGIVWIVTESLFSMDGDLAPLDDIIKLASAYGAKLYVDDAHAFGVNGKNGYGFGVEHPEIDLLLGTFGKAGGSFGAFVASSSVIVDSLINYCNGFIYTTAPPPSVIGSIQAALDLIPKMKSERDHLRELTKYLHTLLLQEGLSTSDEPSHILPIIMESEEIVLEQSRKLKDHGIIATAIRPPTVPEDSCRFRISLTTAHQKSDCDQLMSVIKS